MRMAPPDPSKPRGALARALPFGAQEVRFPGHAVRLTLSEWRARLIEAAATEAERRRLFLWLPVLMGIGILLYFAADREPALWAPMSGALLFSMLAWLLRAKRVALLLCLSLAAIFSGFTAATWRTARLAAPVLEQARIGRLAGFVESVETRDAGARLVILVTDIAGLSGERQPRRVRVTIRSGVVVPGDHIAAVARLLPPPGPARPGGYDFARDAYFHGLGAVGSIPGKIMAAPAPWPAPLSLRISALIDRARNALTERIANMGGGQAGAVAAALVTGKRGQISEDTNIALRAAGIYHIISISGLHMVLAAGTIFALVRGLLAASQTLALRWPVKKLAAGAAMIGATAYCLFSGAEVATVRSLIMTLVMLGSVLVDRPALSMRNLALAAIIVLLLEPEALLGPSFQMSFGAVAALIAFAERWQALNGAEPRPNLPWPLRPIWYAVLGITVTTLLATAATAPFGAYHFQTFNPFGLLGNALALPFVSLIVMPAAVLGVLSYPLGLDGIAWAAMGLASEAVLALAHWVAAFDHSSVVIPAFGPAALLCFAAALLWITLWTTPLRFLFVVPLALGLLVAAGPERPDILVDREGSGIVVRGENNRLILAGQPSRFVLQQWLNADGDGRQPDDKSLREGARCDALGCVIAARNGRSIAYARDRLAIVEDCRRADLVVTPIPWTAPCAARLLDRTALAAQGATALVSQHGGWRIISAEHTAADRPWNRRTGRPAASPVAASDPSAKASAAPEGDAELLQ